MWTWYLVETVKMEGLTHIGFQFGKNSEGRDGPGVVDGGPIS